METTAEAMETACWMFAALAALGLFWVVFFGWGMVKRIAMPPWWP